MPDGFTSLCDKHRLLMPSADSYGQQPQHAIAYKAVVGLG